MALTFRKLHRHFVAEVSPVDLRQVHGMNMFVLKTLLPEVPTGTVFRGVMPFMWADVLRLAILVAFPPIALWLPSLMR